MDKSPIFEFFPAYGTPIGLLSIPHSGEIIPEEFNQYLIDEPKHLMQDLDYRVHELIDCEKIRQAGISILKSNISRVCIDLNRSKDKCLLTWKKNSRGIQIVKDTPEQELTSDLLITNYYSPYFNFLKANLDELNRHQNQVNFVDLHSMPSKATDYHLSLNPKQKVHRPPFCISDQSGKTCRKEFIDFITNELRVNYPQTTNNDPYFGGHITIFVNDYLPECNNIQIEINRSLYMDEDQITLLENKVDRLKPNLTTSIINLFKNFS